jgi:hypothetical protein
MTAARYWMLETIREFAAAELAESDEAADLRERYVAAFRRLAEQHGALLPSALPAGSLAALDTELGNLRQAFALAVDDDAVLTLGATLGEVHAVHGRGVEAEDALRAALGCALDPLIASKLKRLLARVYVRRNELQLAADALSDAERTLAPGERTERWWSEWLELKLAQASHHYWLGDNAALADAVTELRAFVDEHGSEEQRVEFLHIDLLHRMRTERYSLSNETERAARALRDAALPAGQWDAEFSLGFALLWRGNPQEALEYLGAALEAARRVGDVMIQTRCLVYSALARRKLDDVDAVRALDAQIAELEETFSYSGLIAANRAWLAWRDGDVAAAERFGKAAIADWTRVGRAGPTVFQWAGRFPLLAAAVARGGVEEAATQAEAMLHASQQPLPQDVREALQQALAERSATSFGRAIERARTSGYT